MHLSIHLRLHGRNRIWKASEEIDHSTQHGFIRETSIDLSFIIKQYVWVSYFVLSFLFIEGEGNQLSNLQLPVTLLKTDQRAQRLNVYIMKVVGVKKDKENLVVTPSVSPNLILTTKG